MKKFLAPLIAGWIVGLVAFHAHAAALPLYDGFTYAAGNLGAVGSAGGWDAASSAFVAVASGNLTGPSGFPASAGNMIALTKGAGSNYFTFATSGQLTSGQVYFSFLFVPGTSSGASSAGLDIAALTAQDASTPAINVQLRNNSGFKLGIKKAGGTAVFPGSTVTAGTTYLVVGKYDFATTPHTASIWALTTFASTETAAGAATVSINSGTDFSAAAGLGRFYLSGSGVPTAGANIDELRIGTTWASVTAAGAGPAAKLAFTTQPATTLVNATMSAVVVQIQDTNNFAVASNNVPITLTLTTGSGALGGTTTVSSDATGKATFTNLTINTAGTGKQLTATASGIGAGLSNAVSSNFSITNAPVVSVPGSPVITQGVFNVATVILRGTNGPTNGTFQVMATTDVLKPFVQWDGLNTFSFDSTGHFNCTNPVAPGVPKLFYCVKVGDAGLTAPVITSQPQSQSVIIGQNAAFSVAADGTQLSYQWFFNTNTLLNGKTSPTLNLNNAQPGDQGGYSVVITNSVGSVTSLVATLTVNTAPTNGTFYVATNGSDANPGSIDSPFLTLPKAISVVLPGETIYVRGWTHYYSQTIRFEKSGTSNAPIKLLAYAGEKPVFNFTNQPYADANRAFLITTNGNWWQFKGLEICYAGDNAMKLEGSHLRVEQCVFHENGDTGLQIGFGHYDANPGGQLAAFIEVINCDSYLNYDAKTHGGNADGFAAKLHCGHGIVFTGCRAWENSDDGWDLFETDYSVVISNCWVWKSAFVGQGNGNGFKMGGDSSGGSSMGTHYAYNCVAFACKVNGFTQNSHRDGEVVVNCLSFTNGSIGYNYFFEGTVNSGKQNVFKNNVGILRKTNNTGNNFSEDNNTWNLTVTANAADYGDLTEAAAKAPRQADGSLPTGFARLVTGSDLIDKGVNVGIPFNGSAPDLGAYEYAP